MKRNVKKIKAKIKDLKKLEKRFYSKAYDVRNDIRKLKEELKKECNHPIDKVEIVDRDYMDEKMAEPARWKEKVCGVCGKTLATGNIKKEIVWEETD